MKPIIFNTAMVRAILERRKSQTRRVITVPWAHGRRCQPYEPYFGYDEEKKWIWMCDEYSDYHDYPCPYGKKGDKLWVREKYAFEDAYDNLKPSEVPKESSIWGAAISESNEPSATLNQRGKWRSARFMPRWASTTTLQITDVRVERVQDISVENALKEGIQHSTMACPKMEFAQLWSSLNDKRGYGWDVNPYVWVIEFEVACL